MPTVIPVLRYADPRAAIDFLTSAFDFEARQVDTDGDDNVVHADLVRPDGAVMLGPANDSDGAGLSTGAAAVYMVTDSPDADFEQARSAGAGIVFGPKDMDYGSREFGVTDPEGNTWFFGTYQP